MYADTSPAEWQRDTTRTDRELEGRALTCQLGEKAHCRIEHCRIEHVGRERVVLRGDPLVEVDLGHRT